MVDVELNKLAHLDECTGLVYPELYVVKGGYEKIFESFPDLCTPQAYMVLTHQILLSWLFVLDFTF